MEEYPPGHPMNLKIDHQKIGVEKYTTSSRDYPGMFAVVRMFNMNEAHSIGWTKFKHPLGLNNDNVMLSSGYYAVFYLNPGDEKWEIFKRTETSLDYFFRPVSYGQGNQLSLQFAGGEMVPAAGGKVLKPHKGRFVIEQKQFLGLDPTDQKL